MKPNSDHEPVENNASENLTVVPENNTRDRRAFLRRAAMGVAGTAGLVAIGASSVHAESSVKSKILDRIRAQMAQDPQPFDRPGEVGDGGVYVKNAHALYLKK